MRFFHSSKKHLKLNRLYIGPIVGITAAGAFLLGISRHAYSPVIRKASVKSDKTISQHKTTKPATTDARSSSVSGSSTGTSSGGPISPSSVPAATPQFSHLNITSTYFWVGEPGDADNSNISNTESTWDSQWQKSFGGVDSPAGRNGYLPVGFTPKENPFYFALPYSDLDDNGNRKASATNCPNYPALKNQSGSWCKNSWIAIRHNGKVAYAQWEDAGPYGEDDVSYVFGSAAPKNKIDTGAGLDVSPAVHDYLGLGDVGSCDWTFVSAGQVPSGPWSQIITSSSGDNTVN